MIRLAIMIYSFIATTLAGCAVVAALVTGNDTMIAIAIAAGIGFLVAIPASVLVARKMIAG